MHSEVAGQLSGSDSTGADDAFAFEPELGTLTVSVGLDPGARVPPGCLGGSTTGGAAGAPGRPRRCRSARRSARAVARHG